jgi:hypothetical protein
MGVMFCLSTQPARAVVTVTVQPPSQVVFVGSNAVFNAQTSASGGETITGYTWKVSTNGSSYNVIAGATTATCTLTNVQTSNSGSYFTVVTYNSGTNIGLQSASSAVTLTVPDQARITAQPQGGFILPTGTNVSFSVSALGQAPLSYQWRLNRTNLVSNSRITGANGTNLTINALVTADSGSYDVVVTNVYDAVTSQVATLSVFIPVGIGVPPQNATVILGSNAVFSVTATGSPPFSFQWQEGGTNLSNGGRVSGATSNVLTIAATVTNDASSYAVSITNPVSALTSAVATLTVLVPATFTSATSVAWRQGLFFSFTNTATGTLPITFGAEGLPDELSLEPTNGVISGIPLVTGVFDVAIFATNAAMTTTEQLALTLTTGAPGITSALSASGKQGQNFTYTIAASNNPTSFSASALPVGLSFDPVAGVISGPPIVSGTFPITLGAINPYGSDSQVLTLTLASAVPVITSALTATGTQNQSSFSYRIRASNSPTVFGASDLPLGLALNTTNGAITGTPLLGGTFTVPIWAINAWGTGQTNLTLNIGYATIGGLAITDVITTWAQPYLLDFSFSLRDGPDPATSLPVVVPPSLLQVVCMENGVPVPDETAVVLESLATATSKQLKTFLVLDYTYSMFIVPGAISNMQAAAELLINEEPPAAQFGIYEFSADYLAPQLVTTNGVTTNGFLANKTTLDADIEGIQTNFVQGNYAGSRCWDAIYAALSQFGPYTTNNYNEQRYIVAMTDGNDDSSLLDTNADPVATLVSLAETNQVEVYCVAFGDNVNTNALEELTSQTGGQYYLAATTTDLGTQFQKILQEVDATYLLRWATLQRAALPAYLTSGFQPSFQVTYQGFTASWNTNIVMTNIITIDTNKTPAVTNSTPTNIIQFPYNPPDWSNDVRVGSVLLVPDADIGPQTIRLQAFYVPRYIREIQINYRPNYPCTSSLDSTATNEILYGWSMTETTDTNGLRTLTMVSPDTNNLLTSIEYGAFGNLVEFDFTYPDSVTATQAFSVFSINNSIYSNMVPSGQSFVLQNATNFITSYTNAPLPHGTPIPWLIYYGFKTNFAAAELITTNGLPVWQDYLAGLNPTNANSRFTVSMAYAAGQAPQITFSTVADRTYRVETATSLDSWSVLLDNIPGTGGNITFTDNRVLSGVSAVFYRVAVY